MNSIVKP
jgi:hypothetical protein